MRVPAFAEMNFFGQAVGRGRRRSCRPSAPHQIQQAFATGPWYGPREQCLRTAVAPRARTGDEHSCGVRGGPLGEEGGIDLAEVVLGVGQAVIVRSAVCHRPSPSSCSTGVMFSPNMSAYAFSRSRTHPVVSPTASAQARRRSGVTGPVIEGSIPSKPSERTARSCQRGTTSAARVTAGSACSSARYGVRRCHVALTDSPSRPAMLTRSRGTRGDPAGETRQPGSRAAASWGLGGASSGSAATSSADSSGTRAPMARSGASTSNADRTPTSRARA